MGIGKPLSRDLAAGSPQAAAQFGVPRILGGAPASGPNLLMGEKKRSERLCDLR